MKLKLKHADYDFKKHLFKFVTNKIMNEFQSLKFTEM